MQPFARTLLLGFKSLLLHKLRSSLTVLGILIGVMSVVWLLAIGEGISTKVQEQIRELGATNIMVRSIKPPLDSSEGITGGSFILEYGIKRADYRRITETIPTIVRALPIREIRKELRYRHRALDCRLVGCTPEYFAVNHLAMDRGRFISPSDMDDRANYAVLAYTTAEKLFPFENPVGKTIQLDQDFYSIVGTTRKRTPSAGIGGSLAAQDFNQDVYIPYTTLRTRIGDQVITARSGSREGEMVELSQITLTVGDIGEVMDTKEMIEGLLAQYHRTQDWAVVAPLELLEQARIMRLLFNIFLGLIAAISLVVGGIGIMNIMLATVTERTREIGIRRALGAKQRDITRQFLAETTVLSALGGAFGAAGGLACYPMVVGLRELLGRVLAEQWQQLPPIITTLEPSIAAYIWSIPIAFAIAVGIGVVFGLYPARRAAKMDPIEALRHE
jgi:putative ABC transport system permease protein